MKFLKLVILLAGLLTAGVGSQAVAQDPMGITVEGMVIGLPREQVLQFIADHNLNAAPEEGLKTLQHMVQQKQAESMANPAITTKSGQSATIEAGTTKIQVEPVASPDGNKIDTNLLFDYGGKKLTTSFMAKNGDVKFLGAIDSTDPKKNDTYLVFVRVRAAK